MFGQRYFAEIVHAVHAKQIQMIRRKPLEALVQPRRQNFRTVRTLLRGEKHLLPYIGISRNKTPEALLAQTVPIHFGCIPEIHAPVEGLPEEQLVVDRVEYPPKRQGRYFDARFPQPALGHGTFASARLFRSGCAAAYIQPG